MSSEFRKKHKLHNRHDFRYYYENSNNILKDFENYLVVQVRHNQKQASQYRNNVTQIWTAVDSNRAIFPRNYLRDTDILKDYFYRPLYVSLQENLKLPKEEQSPYIQAATIKSKLCSLSVFCRFLINRSLFINLTIEDIQHLILKVKELCKSLKSIDEREKVVTKFKSDTLLTVKNLQDYGTEHVSSINSTLVKSEKNKKDLKLTKQSAIDIRDYLMVSLTYFNCLWASNLMNISLEDVKKNKKA